MISIKKYLDATEKAVKAAATNEGTAAESPAVPECVSMAGDFRSLMIAMARSVMVDGSAHGIECGGRLLRLHRQVGPTPTAEAVHQAETEIEVHLEQWSTAATSETEDRNEEIHELIKALANATESIGSRDQRNASEIRQMTENLETLGTVNDIRLIRSTLVTHVARLRSTVEQMQKESELLLTSLQHQVTEYETRLKSVENLVATDGLTGLANRRGLEERIAANIASEMPFCVVLFDLNRFKFVNDSLGHMAGDDLLRQFAERLREGCRRSDLVGRWGGDEFVIVAPGMEEHLRPRVVQLRDGACGRYTLKGNFSRQTAMDVEAAVGLAEWREKETVSDVFARADADMYEDKKRLNSRFGHTRVPGNARPQLGTVA